MCRFEPISIYTNLRRKCLPADFPPGALRNKKAQGLRPVGLESSNCDSAVLEPHDRVQTKQELVLVEVVVEGLIRRG